MISPFISRILVSHVHHFHYEMGCAVSNECQKKSREPKLNEMVY